MEPFKYVKFEHSLREKLKAELVFGPGQDEAFAEFMAVAKGLMASIQQMSTIEQVDKELILSGLVGANLFGLFDQEERLRIGSSIFLGMMLNSFLTSEGINYGVEVSPLGEEDVQHVRDQISAVAFKIIEKGAIEVRRYVEELYAPLKDFPEKVGDTESDENPSLS